MGTAVYDFSGYADRAALLADGWTFIGNDDLGTPRDTEDAAALSYATGGGLTIDPLSPGELWSGDNTTLNLLLRDLPSDWTEFQLKASAELSGSNPHVGIGVYESDDNYLTVLRAHGLDRRVVRNELDGTGGQAFFGSGYSANPFWTRVVRTGPENFDMMFSEDGTTWALLRNDFKVLDAGPTPRLFVMASGGGTTDNAAVIQEVRVTAPSIGGGTPATYSVALGANAVTLALGANPVTPG